MDALLALLKAESNAANAFGALASAAAAFLALLLACISIGISVWAARLQRKHNELSVRPLAEVTVADFENSLRIKLRNNGTGPMVITSVAVTKGSVTHSSIIEWMPSLPSNRPWNTFSHALSNRSLQPGGEIVLLELTEYPDEVNFAESRESVRASLASLTVNVSYTDIYNKAMPVRIKSLEWFGRHK
jgi:hypothetical protein